MDNTVVREFIGFTIIGNFPVHSVVIHEKATDDYTVIYSIDGKIVSDDMFVTKSLDEAIDHAASWIETNCK